MKILILSFVLVVLALPAGASAGVIGKPTNNLGLAGYWSFNEGRGTSAGDSSGHGYTAAIDGSVTWTSGKLGAALDHPNNNVGSATNYDGNPATVTYTAWIFPRTVGEGGVFGAIAKQGLGRTVGLCSGNAACGSLTNTLVFSDEDWDAVPGVWYTNADTIRMNAWNFVTVTYDRSSDTNDPLMYINGVSVQVNEYLPPSGGVGNSVGTLNIGRGGGTQGLDGKLDELRIYSRILTAAQIADLYKSGSTGSGSYSAQGGSSSLTNGLVGHWTMDGTDVTDKVYDRSGQGNNGYFWGSATSSAKFLGKLGQAMRFNGTTDVVYVGDVNAMDGLTRITVSAWVKSPAAGANGTNEAHIADKSDCTGAAGDGPFDLTQYPGTNKAFFAVYDAGGTGQSNLGTINIDDGNWHFLLGQYDGADVSIWVDGVRDSFQTVGAFTLANTSKPFNIGGYCANAHMSWKGMIDDVRVYNRAISTTEMKQLYNLGSQKMNASSKILTNGGLNSGLVAHWTFDGADVTDKVYDRSGNSHDAYFRGRATSSAKTIGKIGQAMRFNGTADSAIVYTGGGAASALDNIDYLTVSAWIKPDADMTASGEIFDKTSNGGQPTDGPDIWYEPAASNRLLFAQGFTGGNGYAVWYSDNAISPGQWQHVAVVYSRASASNNPIMYVNGAALTVAADVSFPAVGTAKDDSAHDTIIGAYGSANVAGFFKGLIDDVRVYNRILNASEVKQLYNLGR